MEVNSNPVKADARQTLIDISVESWRFAKLFLQLATKLEPGEGARFINRYRYYMRRLAESLDQAGVRIVNVEGQRYEAGMAVTALNVADFGVDDPLWVDQMLEPILMGPEGIISVGTVTVRNSAV